MKYVKYGLSGIVVFLIGSGIFYWINFFTKEPVPQQPEISFYKVQDVLIPRYLFTGCSIDQAAGTTSTWTMYKSSSEQPTRTLMLVEANQ